MEEMKTNILFIDDDKATNFYNKKVASNTGKFSSIISVESGIEGLEYIKSYSDSGKTKPDLIFLDINMPAMNGWEFLQEFNCLERTLIEGIDIIILSTSKDPNDLIRFKEYEILIKPLSTETLENVCKKYNAHRIH